MSIVSESLGQGEGHHTDSAHAAEFPAAPSAPVEIDCQPTTCFVLRLELHFDGHRAGPSGAMLQAAIHAIRRASVNDLRENDFAGLAGVSQIILSHEETGRIAFYPEPD